MARLRRDTLPQVKNTTITVHTGSRRGLFDISAECARFVVDRRLPIERLITHRFRLDEAHDAYQLFDSQTTGKGVLVFG